MDQGGWGWIRGVVHIREPPGASWQPHRDGSGQNSQSQLCRLSIASCPRSCIKYNRIFSQDGLPLAEGLETGSVMDLNVNRVLGSWARN